MTTEGWNGTERRAPSRDLIDALTGVTTELVATRATIEQLPTRPEVDARIVEERVARRRSFRWLGIFITIQTVILLSVGALVEDTHDISQSNERINEATLDLTRTIDCVVRVASTLSPGDEQRAAYGTCIAEANGGNP